MTPSSRTTTTLGHFRDPVPSRQKTRKRNPWPPPKAALVALIKEAVVDAYTESEQRTAFCTLLDERLTIPFAAEILGAEVTFESVDMLDNEQVVAICGRGRSRQAIPILELPLPNPHPAGVEWIEAYRLWATGNW